MARDEQDLGSGIDFAHIIGARLQSHISAFSCPLDILFADIFGKWPAFNKLERNIRAAFSDLERNIAPFLGVWINKGDDLWCMIAGIALGHEHGRNGYRVYAILFLVSIRSKLGIRNIDCRSREVGRAGFILVEFHVSDVDYEWNAKLGEMLCGLEGLARCDNQYVRLGLFQNRVTFFPDKPFSINRIPG